MLQDSFGMEMLAEPKSSNILIVDDDPAVLRLLSHLLKEDDYFVRTARDGEEALERILRDCPDVVISDWEMPKMDGLELSKTIRQFHDRKALPHYVYILLLTAHTGKDRLIKGLESGADDFVTKSADLREMRIELSARLKAAIRTRSLERDLEKAARADALTGLFNRATFFDMATMEWERSERFGHPLSLAMFDCDFFKRVNDLHGHAAGDVVLEELAAMVRDSCRDRDILCRYGGEEFCVLLPKTTEEDAGHWAERIRKKIAEQKIYISDAVELQVTASFGVAQKTDELMEIDQLVEQADQALLAAKELGRNRTVSYTETIAEDHHLENGMKLEEQLFDNITAGEVMSPIFHCIHKDEPVASVVDFFLQTRVGSLPVVDDDGTLFGIVSERNFLGMVGQEHRWNQPVHDLVTVNVISYTADTPIRAITEFLGRVSIRQVVIVEKSRPLGMISRNSLLRWLRNRWLALSGTNKKIANPEHAEAQYQANLQEKIKLLASDLQALEHRLDRETPELEAAIITQLTRIQELAEQLLGLCTTHREMSDSADSPSWDHISGIR